jgi:acetyl esterase/lipase
MSVRPHRTTLSHGGVERIATGALCIALSIAQACAGTSASPAPAPAAAGQPPASRASAPAASTTAMLPLVARAQPTFPLWASGAPGALGTTPADQPDITPYLPPAGRANGTAVVVFPGGGYVHLSMDKEGSEIANWLALNGVTAFVVKYRLGPKYHHPTEIGDAQRAIRTVRARATEWSVDPNRVGIIGFSAGGHLAATAGTHFDTGTPSSGDVIERASSRPDFMLLIYPVITMRDSVLAHHGSRVSLLGENPDTALVHRMSIETQVTRESPPAFIVHSTDDRTVPVENSLMMYQALRNAAVPVEMHIFEHGGHGFGLATRDPVLSAWPTLGAAWMRRHGWLTPAR